MLRVLVVDDRVDSAEILADVLSSWGHDVRQAYDGPTAIELALQFEPALVLLDIGLPVLDGFEVARRMRGESRLAGARLVALTGYGRDSDRRAAEDAGFDGYLVKPVDTEALRRIIARFGGGSRAGS